MPRDRALEQRLLDDWARDPAFAELVLARLDAAEAEYGVDSFRERSLANMIGEAHEETLDAPGWVALAHQLPPPESVSAADYAHALRLLGEGCVLVAYASSLFRTAQSLVTPDAPA